MLSIGLSWQDNLLHFHWHNRNENGGASEDSNLILTLSLMIRTSSISLAPRGRRFRSVYLDMEIRWIPRTVVHNFGPGTGQRWNKVLTPLTAGKLLIGKGIILWDLTPYSMVEVYRRFERSSCLHLQSRRSSQASNKKDASNNFLQNVSTLPPYCNSSHPRGQDCS
jgi:hypothetical protein